MPTTKSNDPFGATEIDRATADSICQEFRPVTPGISAGNMIPVKGPVKSPVGSPKKGDGVAIQTVAKSRSRLGPRLTQRALRASHAHPKKNSDDSPSLTLGCNVKQKSLSVGAKGTVAVVLGYCLGGGMVLVALAVAGAVACKILK